MSMGTSWDSLSWSVEGYQIWSGGEGDVCSARRGHGGGDDLVRGSSAVVDFGAPVAVIRRQGQKYGEIALSATKNRWVLPAEREPS